MAKHKNFYETINEMSMRITNTLVLYKGVPHYVLAVANHKSDGIFRVYLDPMPSSKTSFKFFEYQEREVPYLNYDGFCETGVNMDKYLDSHKSSRIVRKMANSPHFENFRPFPLGFVNSRELGKEAVFTERAPTRHTQQGLTQTMISFCLLPNLVSPGSTSQSFSSSNLSASLTSINNPTLHDTIVGGYPSASEALASTKKNKACAFHRLFAFCSGPAGSVFLSYKGEIAGMLVSEDLQQVKLSKSYNFLKESVEELNTFQSVLTEN